MKTGNIFGCSLDCSNDEYLLSRNKLKKSLNDIICVQTCALSYDNAFELSKASNREIFDNVVVELAREGKIVVTKKNKLMSPKIAGLVPARISSIAKGFSFASPLSSNLPDIYISLDKLKGARVDDIVLLKHIHQSKKGFSAHIDTIVFKSNRFIKGIFETSNKGSFFFADKSYQTKIPVSNKDTMNAKSGDKVQAYILKNKKQLSAKITKIYGHSESAKVCSDAIIDFHGILNEFNQGTIEESAKLSNYKISSNEIKKRLDLRSENIFTIDGEDAKDLDDAISVKKIPSGYELGVHIADVSHFVKTNSEIDKSSRERGTSVYFADRVIPMLPEQLSNGVCSLNSGEDKLTFSVILEISPEGSITKSTLRKSIINSKVRGIYSEVNQIIEGNASEYIKEKYSSVQDSILLSKELADILSQASNERGYISFSDNESIFSLNEDGVCIDIKPRYRGSAEILIENFMIKANEAVAKYAKSHELPFIYRIHPAPDIERLNSLFTMLRLLGLKCPSLKNNVNVKGLRNIVEQAKETPLERLTSNRVLRAMSKAIYSESPEGHFGLALEDYCHFTSPIRRYPDLAIHRILSSNLIKSKKNKVDPQFIDFVINVSDQATQCEIRAMNAERDAEKCYMAEYAKQHIGEIYNGVITGINPRGIFIELENSVEGFLKNSSFVGKSFIYDGFSSCTDSISNEKLCIGDSISVQIVKAVVSIGTIEFQPV